MTPGTPTGSVIAICKAQILDAALDELDIEGVLNAADFMLRNLSTIWDSLLIDDRQRFQRVLFPDGLPYSEEQGFGTLVTSPVVNVLQRKSAGDDKVARPRGVEPRLPG